MTHGGLVVTLAVAFNGGLWSRWSQGKPRRRLIVTQESFTKTPPQAPSSFSLFHSFTSSLSLSLQKWAYMIVQPWISRCHFGEGTISLEIISPWMNAIRTQSAPGSFSRTDYGDLSPCNSDLQNEPVQCVQFLVWAWWYSTSTWRSRCPFVPLAIMAGNITVYRERRELCCDKQPRSGPRQICKPSCHAIAALILDVIFASRSLSATRHAKANCMGMQPPSSFKCIREGKGGDGKGRGGVRLADNPTSLLDQ